MAVVEAAACGTASVGTAVGALADDQALGTAISENLPEALARAIQDALPRAEAMGEIARARARSAYDVRQTAQSLSELYAEISAAH
jgi:glycosyltransferase involved in cell wall biosynthesis